MTRRRRCTKRRPLRGKNFAVSLGFFLQPLLQPLPSPLATLSFYFQLDLPQTAEGRLFRVHSCPFVVVGSELRMRNHSPPNYRGSVKTRPRSGFYASGLDKPRVWCIVGGGHCALSLSQRVAAVGTGQSGGRSTGDIPGGMVADACGSGWADRQGASQTASSDRRFDRRRLAAAGGNCGRRLPLGQGKNRATPTECLWIPYGCPTDTLRSNTVAPRWRLQGSAVVGGQEQDVYKGCTRDCLATSLLLPLHHRHGIKPATRSTQAHLPGGWGKKEEVRRRNAETKGGGSGSFLRR